VYSQHKNRPNRTVFMCVIRYFAILASVRRALVETRSLMLPMRFVWMFTLNVRRLAMLEWLRLLPEAVPRPVSWHVRLIRSG